MKLGILSAELPQKKCNQHLKTKLIETAKITPQWNEPLAQLREKELARGPKNRAALAVARKLVEYMLAVDRQENKSIPFFPIECARAVEKSR